MGKQCWSQAVLESGSWGHSVLQTPALVIFFKAFVSSVNVKSPSNLSASDLFYLGHYSTQYLGQHLSDLFLYCFIKGFYFFQNLVLLRYYFTIILLDSWNYFISEVVRLK